MTTKNTTATHRVFEAIQGLWPVTFANVREADPQHLLDIFEGAENTRDRYIEVTAAANNITQAGLDWANDLSGFDTDHDDECENNSNAYKHSTDCDCKNQQYANNQQWGTEVYEAIQQRIRELND